LRYFSNFQGVAVNGAFPRLSMATKRRAGAAETLCGRESTRVGRLSLQVRNVVPGCDAPKLRIRCDVLGSGETKHLTLLAPAERQRLGARKSSSGKGSRLATFKDRTDDKRHASLDLANA
jgi:hypothetical protein